MEVAKPRSSRVTWLLILLPAWLLASGAGAMWYYFHHERKVAAVEELRFSRAVSVPLLADDLRKIVELIGERNGSSESAAANLSSAASMVEGVLGPSNTGYPVKSIPGPARWPIFHITLQGKEPKKPAVWVVTSYDSPQGSRGAEANGSGLAACLAAAQAVASDKPAFPVHFVFLPHANDLDSPVIETASKFLELVKKTGTPRAVLCVEAMGSGDDLWLSSREVNAAPLAQVAGLGDIYGAEVVCLGEDQDLSSVLFEMDLPAVRVATRAAVTTGEKDDQSPSATTVAASTGRLIELIRRCAGR